jgi:23S rRNA (cytidine1920-2'-O)/16S rRNA (cytidine1409-2'-O)-methyltransferase
MKGERIDKLLVDLGLAESRTKAQAMVMAGVVLVNEKRVDKPSEAYANNVSIRLKGDIPENRYASRAGLKLEHALQHFHICPAAYVCLDVGSSTGGFTDCLLKQGANKVVAIDSGTNQMVWRLRSDHRVDVRENVNARDMLPDQFTEKFDLAVIDVSFISLKKILPAVIPLLNLNGKIIALIKPQFEVGRGEVGKGGIVRESAKHERVVNEINGFMETLGFRTHGVIESPILGAEGNKEFLSLYARV